MSQARRITYDDVKRITKVTGTNFRAEVLGDYGQIH